MSWGKCNSSSASFPESTGTNQSQTQVATFQGNTQDSDPGILISQFAEVLQSGLAFADAVYDTGNLVLDATRMRLTNNSGKPFSFSIIVQGEFISSSASNTAVIGLRLNSSGELGTGTSRKIPAGFTVGGASIDIGSGVFGAFTLQDGESVWLECSKNVVGTLIMQTCLVFIYPVW